MWLRLLSGSEPQPFQVKAGEVPACRVPRMGTFSDLRGKIPWKNVRNKSNRKQVVTLTPHISEDRDVPPDCNTLLSSHGFHRARTQGRKDRKCSVLFPRLHFTLKRGFSAPRVTQAVELSWFFLLRDLYICKTCLRRSNGTEHSEATKKGLRSGSV